MLWCYSYRSVTGQNSLLLLRFPPRAEFRACENARIQTVCSSCDEDLAVEQQRRRVIIASFNQVAVSQPSAARRIVEFRAREREEGTKTACDEHFPVGQQCRRVA